jgi:2-oxoisovalerate dehydrogenase E1 component
MRPVTQSTVGVESSAPSDQVLSGSPVEELVADFRLACISRALDDREITLQKQSRAYFQISGAGHEALGLAMARYLRPGYDWFFPYYRDTALVLGLGSTAYEILLAAVGSADDPASAGRQMPSHWSSPELAVAPQTSPTGSQCLPAVGCAEAGRYISGRAAGTLEGCVAHEDEVVYVSLGDGATSEGEFWESLNTACSLSLPVLFVVADNGFAISVPALEQSPGPISQLVSGFPGLSIYRVDGCDYHAVRALTEQVVADIRAGKGPALIHAKVTRPYSHSSADNQAKYRPAEEMAEEAARDPLVAMEHSVAQVLGAEGAQAIRLAARAEVALAAKEAIGARRPDPATVKDHLFAEARVGDNSEVEEEESDADGEVVALGEAIRLTLIELMAADERVRVFGQDVADARAEMIDEVEGKGGVFGTTAGLQRAFGQDRCYNTPLAEANIIGRAIGQAVRGLRPFPEIQFFDYIWPAMNQIRSEAATLRWRTAGRFSCPMVMRVPIGGYLAGGAIWHSQSGESIFTHIPGLIVMMPSNARDAVGMLRTALSCGDPVMFLEHKHLLRQRYTATRFPRQGFRVPLGKGRVVRRGSDLSIVTYGAMVERTRRVASALQHEGVSVEIVDLRCLLPWDKELVAETLAKTGRLLVVHEDTLSFGFGAEVAAWVAEHCFGYLDAPVGRVGAADCWVPYEPTLEAAVLPQDQDITAAVRRVLAY